MIGISTDQMFHQLQWARPGATWHTPAVPWSAWEFTSFPQTPPGLRRHETEDGFALKGRFGGVRLPHQESPGP